MARKNQHSFSKRQREQKKAEKAAQKKARRDALKESPSLLPESNEEIASGDEEGSAAPE